jgi:hypothetical protein
MKCAFCDRKLKLVEELITCKCGLKFCRLHRFFDNHKCTFNSIKSNYERLVEENPKVIAQKINKI